MRIETQCRQVVCSPANSGFQHHRRPSSRGRLVCLFREDSELLSPMLDVMGSGT